MSGNLLLTKDTHDIIIGRGATRVTGANQVAQLCKCRLLAQLGEWQQDTSLGLPWYEGIFGKGASKADIESAVMNILRNTNGVRQVLDIEIDADFRERTLQITFTALSVYGDIEGAIWLP